MTDEQKVAAWSGMRIPTNVLRLKNALEVIREALIDVERMGAVARDMEQESRVAGTPVGYN